MNSDLHIPDFTLLKKCGRGAFSDVWIAQDLSSRKVALKIIDKTLPFDRELSGLCACRDLHDLPGLIRILHIGETPEFFYYSMKLADSLTTDRYTPATLSNILKFNGRIPAEKVTAMAQEMLSTLAVLHRMDIIHRDIKPENIMLVNGKFKLSDIGLMRSLTHTFSLAGTLGFIPPERLGADSGTQSAQDDLYALGKVLYCALSGNPVEKFPALIPEITTSKADRLLNRIITKACSRNPRNRFADAGEFLAAINGNMPRWKILFSSPGIMALSGIILAAVVILGAALFFSGKSRPTPPVSVKVRSLRRRMISINFQLQTTQKQNRMPEKAKRTKLRKKHFPAKKYCWCATVLTVTFCGKIISITVLSAVKTRSPSPPELPKDYTFAAFCRSTTGSFFTSM